MPQQLQYHQEAQIVDLPRRTDSKDPNPPQGSRTCEPISQILDKVADCTEDYLLIRRADMVVSAFLAGES